jgi:hypothetical protein
VAVIGSVEFIKGQMKGLPFSPEDRGIIFLQNVGIDLRIYMASQPRRTKSLTKGQFHSGNVLIYYFSMLATCPPHLLLSFVNRTLECYFTLRCKSSFYIVQRKVIKEKEDEINLEFVCVMSETDTQMNVRFQVLTAASMKMAVFSVVAPCSLVEVYQRFRGAFCLHHQGDESL